MNLSEKLTLKREIQDLIDELDANEFDYVLNEEDVRKLADEIVILLERRGLLDK